MNVTGLAVTVDLFFLFGDDKSNTDKSTPCFLRILVLSRLGGCTITNGLDQGRHPVLENWLTQIRLFGGVTVESV